MFLFLAFSRSGVFLSGRIFVQRFPVRRIERVLIARPICKPERILAAQRSGHRPSARTKLLIRKTRLAHLLLRHYLAAIRVQQLATIILGVIARQEYERTGHVVNRAQAPQRQACCVLALGLIR